MRSRSVNRRLATVINQFFGWSGRPSVGHWVAAASKSLLHRVLRQVEVTVAPDNRTEGLRRQLAQQVLGGGRRHRTILTQRLISSWDSMIGRTSATAVAATASGAGHWPSRTAIAVARSKLSQSTIQ